MSAPVEEAKLNLRLVVDALIAKKFVLVLLVVEELNAKKLVDVAKVEDAKVTIDVEARNVPLNARVLTVERYSVASPNAIPPEASVDDARVKSDAPVVVPTPIRPLDPIWKRDVPVDDATKNGLDVEVPIIVNLAIGEDVPIPTFPDDTSVPDAVLIP